MTNQPATASVVVMVRQINLYDAKTNLSSLVEEAAAGTEIIIAKAGRPRARLVAMPAARRTPGKGKGRIWMSKDFDAPLPPDLLKAFGIE